MVASMCADLVKTRIRVSYLRNVTLSILHVGLPLTRRYRLPPSASTSSSSRVCHHTSRAQFSSHVLVLTSSSISPWIPSGGRWMGQSPLVMWSAVCSAPQSHDYSTICFHWHHMTLETVLLVYRGCFTCKC